MGLFVSTTGTDVTIPELGITLTDPTTDYDLGAQFRAYEIKEAPSLTTAIQNGTLEWKKTAGGATQPAADYDEDHLINEEQNTGPGIPADQLVKRSELTQVEGKARYVAIAGLDSNANAGKWLDFYAGNRSDEVPYVLPEPSVLKAISASCNRDSTGTITIYKNGSSLDSISFSSNQKTSKAGLSHSFSVNDEVSIQVTSGQIENPNLYLFFKVQ